MMRPVYLGVLSALLFSVAVTPPAWPADSGALQPCQDPFSSASAEYQEEVRRALFPNRALFSSEPIARVIVLPSFEPEWSVSVAVEPETAMVELRTVDTKISLPHGASDDERRDSKAPPRIRRANLSKDVAERIGSVWRSKLLHLGPRIANWTSDGTTLHVSSWVQGYGFLCGELSLTPEGQPDVINQITHLLRDLASEKSTRMKLEEWLTAVLDDAEGSTGCTDD